MKAQAIPLNELKTLGSASRLLLLKKNRGLVTVPEKVQIKSSPTRHAFQMNGFVVLSGELADLADDDYTPLRQLLDEFDSHLSNSLATGASLVNWDDLTQCCGRCGENLVLKPMEIGKSCSKCQQNFYPSIQPVAIVLVKRGQELLLAKGLPPKKHHSCLAGFVEVGESVEDTIHREIKEEVQVEVQNLRYFGSQCWPFPSNLMLGFIADWKSGDIAIDEKELTHAAWFSRENLPEILPPKVSIARQMIDSVLGTFR